VISRGELFLRIIIKKKKKQQKEKRKNSNKSGPTLLSNYATYGKFLGGILIPAENGQEHPNNAQSSVEIQFRQQPASKARNDRQKTHQSPYKEGTPKKERDRETQEKKGEGMVCKRGGSEGQN